MNKVGLFRALSGVSMSIPLGGSCNLDPKVGGCVSYYKPQKLN